MSLGLGIMVLAVVQACVSTCWYTSFVASVDKAARLLARPSVRQWLTGISAAGLFILALTLLFSSSR